MTTCLILGGNGFIGSHLAEGLVNKSYEVKVFDCFPNGPSNLKKIINKIEIIKGDFLNDRDINNALRNVDVVYHYISTTIPMTAKINPIYDVETNIIGSVKILQQAVNNNVNKIVFPSSGGTIYGEPKNLPVKENDPVNPIDPYGISKLAIEKYLYYFNHTYGLDYRILRYSNPYGERQNPYGKQGVIPIFLNKIKQGQNPTIIGDGSMIRDYIYILDAIDATIAVSTSNSNDKIFNIGSGEGKSLNQIIDSISKVIGKEIDVNYEQGNVNYVQKIVLDISRIQEQIDWKPTTNLENGIFRTWQWINDNY